MSVVPGRAPGSNGAEQNLWQEALGMTVEGMCSRHPQCPVWVSAAGVKVASCRECNAEEKSAGLHQRQTFTAVVQQLTKKTDASSGSSDKKVEIALPGSPGSASSASSGMNPWEPQSLEALLKRLGQVQNWSLRQKEKEIHSLQLQIHQLEQQRADAEQTVTEQDQTIRALRRTIQQDLKLIKTMATQKQMELEQQGLAEMTTADETDDSDDDDGRSPLRLPRNLHQKPKPDASPASSSRGSPAKRTPGSTPKKDQRLQGHMKMFQRGGASSYWNDNDVSLASNPSKLFASFRGGLLDIPKSPPPHMHNQRNKVELQKKDLNMDALQIPAGSVRGPASRRIINSSTHGPPAPVPEAAPVNDDPSRGVSRHKSAEPTDFGPMVNPPPLRKGKRKPKAKLQIESPEKPGQPIDNKEIPLDLLAQTLTALPLSRKLDHQSPEQFFSEKKVNAGLPVMAPLGSAGSSVDKSGEAKGSTSPNNAMAPQSSEKRNASIPVRTPSDIGDLPLNSAHSTDTEPFAEPQEPSALAMKLAEARGYEGPDKYILGQTTIATHEGLDNMSHLTGESNPTFHDESTVTSNFTVASNGDKFTFPVTCANCNDKYGDTGEYTGTILVTEGLPHGNGKMMYDSGRVYSGEWVSGQWNGQGKLLNPNGDTYEGEFVLDARDGKGLYKWDNGDIYTGMFREDKRHGQGKFCFHNGNVYDGEFCDGMFDGYGKYKFDGGYYEGEWKEGKYHGQGELEYAAGGKYTGEFRNSVAHGFGTEVSADGEKRRGIWENGQPAES